MSKGSWSIYRSYLRPVLARLYGDSPTNSLEFATTKSVFNYNYETDMFVFGTFTRPLDTSRTNHYVASESAGEATIVIRRIGDVSGSATVQYSMADETAADGQDYHQETGLVTFQPLESSKTIPIHLLDDAIPEPSETILLSLSQASNVAMIGLPSARLRIADDDSRAQLPGFVAGQFEFEITGPTNATIVVEACTNLVAPFWLPVSTNTLNAAGLFSFRDPESSQHPARFYRFRSP